MRVERLLKGSVAPVLGTSVRGALPDADQLAAHLAASFKLDRGSRDLASVAQFVAVTRGERRLLFEEWLRPSSPLADRPALDPDGEP